MPLDPIRVEEARSWFARANADLRGAKIDLEADPPLIEDAVFPCQQATEKALKGFLAWNDQPFRKTHNLVELGVQCSGADPTLEDLLSKAASLSEYATIYRYPGIPENPTLAEANDALSLAQEVVHKVLARLPGEVRP